MHIIEARSHEDLSKRAAIIIAAEILMKPCGVIGFATGRTPVATYKELVRMYREGLIDFNGITTFNLDEYYNCSKTDWNSYYRYMREHLFEHVNIQEEKVGFPNGTAPDIAAECARYEKAIDDAGGIDLQLLGIGHNGHIGFNEPNAFFEPCTHYTQLAESTIDANAGSYASREDVPKYALSMGIGTIMKARKILLLINGKDKKEITEKALYGPVTPQVPASILQYHTCCTVIISED